MEPDTSIYFNASLSCMDLGHIEASLDRIHHANIHSLHYDMVDGIFNECFIFGDQMLQVFRQYTDLKITVHLACKNPERYLKPIIHNGADYIAVHYEADVNILDLFANIRELGAKPVLAFCCDTEVPEDFIQLATQAEWILKLTVFPGFSGQSFHKEALRHIQDMHQQLAMAQLDRIIEVDGNIHAGTIATCASAGATMFTVGTSGLFTSKHSLDENIEILTQVIHTRGGYDNGTHHE